jgi:hypothetical protein
VASSKEVIRVQQFFTNLNSIVNIICVSCNRFEELWIVQASKNAHIIEIDKIESRMKLNQITT